MPRIRAPPGKLATARQGELTGWMSMAGLGATGEDRLAA